MPSMRGGCGSAHTGSLCISIIILIIVIILIVMVCCNYNYNYGNYNYGNYNYGNYNYGNYNYGNYNYGYNQPPPPRIQSPGAAAAAAYKYGKNGGMDRFANVPYNPWGTCDNKPNCKPCSTMGIGGVCINSKCYSNPSIVESCKNSPVNKNNFNNGGNSCDNKPAGATCWAPIGEGAEATGTCYNGNCATFMCKNKANGDSCIDEGLAHASCVNSVCRSVNNNPANKNNFAANNDPFLTNCKNEPNSALCTTQWITSGYCQNSVCVAKPPMG